MNPQLIEDYVTTNVSILKSLANKTRLKVLCCLVDGEKTVSEILGNLEEDLGLSQSSLSQHLGRMREDGVVQSRRDSRHIFYSLTGSDVQQILECLSEISESKADKHSDNARTLSSVHQRNGFGQSAYQN